MPFKSGRYILPQPKPTFADGVHKLLEATDAVNAELQRIEKRREESLYWAEEDFEYDRNEEAKEGER